MERKEKREKLTAEGGRWLVTQGLWLLQPDTLGSSPSAAMPFLLFSPYSSIAGVFHIFMHYCGSVYNISVYTNGQGNYVCPLYSTYVYIHAQYYIINIIV